MIRITIIATLVFIANISMAKAQTNEYKKFRTGKFKYENNDDFIIKRTKRKQIEYNPKTKEKVVMRIKWKSDKEYTLKSTRIKNMPGCLKKGDVIFTVITSVSGNKSYCSFYTKNCGEGESVIIKIE